jgi:hypothetical protein
VVELGGLRVSSWAAPNGAAYRASGCTFGWSATLGLALVLDFFDQGLSRQMDDDVGINRTLLFVEFSRSSVNDFGSATSWQFAPEYPSWNAGIRFAF